MPAPRTRYAVNGAARIADQTVGRGSFDLVFIPGFPNNFELLWEDASFALFARRLTAFARLVLIDPRGVGVVDGDRVAFKQAGAYPDGAKVLSLSMLTPRGGRIAEQTTVQAWDE